MNHIKTYEGFLDKFYKFVAKGGKIDKFKPSENKLKEPDYVFSEDEILDIKDMLLDMVDKYGLEEDEEGKLMQYIDLHGTNRKGRRNPQFFIEREMGGKLLVFSIASSSNFITQEFKDDVQEFKDRLERAGYKCGSNDTLHRIWINYISFYVNKGDTLVYGSSGLSRSKDRKMRILDRSQRISNRMEMRNSNREMRGE